jgi:hypothetical protein
LYARIELREGKAMAAVVQEAGIAEAYIREHLTAS